MGDIAAVAGRGLRVATHATVRRGRRWLGVVLARQADLSCRLGATGRCATTAERSSKFFLKKTTHRLMQKVTHCDYY